jgi:hypothetical protein
MNNCARFAGEFDGVNTYWISGYEGLYSVSKCGRVWSHFQGGRWRSLSLAGSGYPQAQLSKGGEKKTAYVHRLMAQTFLGSIESLEVDHINGVKTDNRIENLRLATRVQNLHNSRAKTGGTSRYKGVDFFKRTGKWDARISIYGRIKCLGRHDTEEEAAAAYDRAAAEFQGEFAKPNLP